MPPHDRRWSGEPLPASPDAFGVAALYKGLAIGRMGVVAPVASVITAILPVLFGFRTEGMPGGMQLLDLRLALASIWLIARPDGEIDSHRGLGLAVLAGVMFGLFLVSGKQAGHNGVFWPLVAARAASTVLMLTIVAFSPRDSRPLRAALWFQFCFREYAIPAPTQCSSPPLVTDGWTLPLCCRRSIRQAPSSWRDCC